MIGRLVGCIGFYNARSLTTNDVLQNIELYEIGNLFGINVNAAKP